MKGGGVFQFEATLMKQEEVEKNLHHTHKHTNTYIHKTLFLYIHFNGFYKLCTLLPLFLTRWFPTFGMCMILYSFYVLICLF